MFTTQTELWVALLWTVCSAAGNVNGVRSHLTSSYAKVVQTAAL